MTTIRRYPLFTILAVLYFLFSIYHLTSGDRWYALMFAMVSSLFAGYVITKGRKP